MKKILIVNKSFETGGIQSSLVNMANALADSYQVDLLVYDPDGPMKQRLNPKVNVLPSSWRLRALGMPMGKALHSGSLRIAAYRIFAAAWCKLVDNRLPVKLAIRHQSKLTGYDLAIAFHQEQRKNAVVSGFTRVVDACVEAKKKAAWIHFDSERLDLDSSYNMPFYEKMDHIVCCSRSVMKHFAEKHPNVKEMEYCYNLIDYEQIREKSDQVQPMPFPKDAFICYSACRLSKEKALPRAIRAMADIFRENPKLMWYIAGEGVEKEKIEAAIKEAGLRDQIILTGSHSNPYPYMKNADMVMNVSYHEAAPMVYLEAKCLGVPVFATKTASTEEMLDDGVNAFICENSEEGIRETFAQLMACPDRVRAAKGKLQGYTGGNEQLLLKIEKLLN